MSGDPLPVPRPTESVVPLVAVPEEKRAEHRAYLLQLETKAQEAYDRTVLTLSGGALSVSFAFVTSFLGETPATSPGLLHGAWLLWVSSLALALVGNYLSTLAMRQAINDHDADVERETPGGWPSGLIRWMNPLAGLLFLGGLFVMGQFVAVNVR